MVDGHLFSPLSVGVLVGSGIMVRYPTSHKARVRQQIIKKAATLFRKRGTDVSIIDLMSQVGLTHGGFYAHFESRDELAQQAFDAAMMQTMERWKEAGGGPGAQDSVDSIVRHYLSASHRDHPESGCPLPIFGASAARQEKSTRQLFAKKLGEFVSLIEATSSASDGRNTKLWALSAVATMVGALMLSRATAGEEVSLELLNAASQMLADSRKRMI